MTERMSPTEAIMWAVEKDPELRSDFLNITLLDRSPDDARLRAKVAAALVEMPRLAQRVVSPPLGLATPEWRSDPNFALEYHLRRIALPAPGTMRELLDVAAALSATPFDRSRPLWEFTVIEGLEGGRAALLQKVHHTITDGVGGLKLSLSLVDLEPTPTVIDTPPTTAARAVAVEVEEEARHDLLDDPVRRDSPINVLHNALDDTVRRNMAFTRQVVGSGLDLLVHPAELPRRAAAAVALAGSVRRQLLVAGPARSPVMVSRSLGRRFDVFSVSLDEARRVGKVLGGSVNDVYVTGVAGALGLYHERMGGPVEQLRMAMPVSTRSGDTQAANQFAPSRVVVSLGPKDPVERFRLVQSQIAELRHEPALAAADSLAGVLAGLPTSLLVGVTRNQAHTIDFAASNLRGSPVSLYIAGARIEGNHAMGPRSGCALNVTLLSYCSQLDMGLHSDPAAVTDPESLVDCFRESFDALLAIT